MRRILITAGIAIGCFIQGSLIGLVLLYLVVDPGEPVPNQIVVLPTTGTASPTVEANHRALAVAYLQQRDAFRALPLLQKATEAEEDSSDLILALATCFEIVKDYDHALKYFEQIVNSRLTGETTTRARMGIVRCLLKSGQPDRANAMLWQRTMNSHPNGELNADHDDLTYLLGCSLARTGMPANADLFYDETALALPEQHNLESMAWSEIDLFIEQPATDAPASRKRMGMSPTGQQLSIQVISNDSASLDSTLLNIATRQTNSFQVVTELANALGIALEVSSNSRMRLESTRFDSAAMHVQASVLLDSLALPNELVWQFGSKGLTIDYPGNMDSLETRQSRLSAARRLLNQAMAAAPQNPQYLDGLFHLAMVDAAADQYQLAITKFQTVSETAREADVRQHCYFNLAKLYRLMGQHELSIDAMQQVVNATVVGDALTVCYLLLGQMNLEKGNLEEALYAFSRAIHVGVDPLYRQLAAVNLAVTYFLDSRPRLANQSLLKYNELIQDVQLREFSKLLSALSNYTVDPSPVDPRDNRAVNLVASLSVEISGQSVGPQALLIKGIGLNQLGFYSETARLFDNSSFAEANWLNAYSMDVAIEAMIAARRFDAVEDLLKESEFIPTPQSLRTLFRWAEIQMQRGNDGNSREICLRIIKMNPEEQLKSDTMRLLGRLSRRSRDYRQAALYYSGVSAD